MQEKMKISYSSANGKGRRRGRYLVAAIELLQLPNMQKTFLLPWTYCIHSFDHLVGTHTSGLGWPGGVFLEFALHLRPTKFHVRQIRHTMRFVSCNVCVAYTYVRLLLTHHVFN